MSWSELLNPFYVYRKRHRIAPFIVDELGGKIRCHCAGKGLFLSDNERNLATYKNRHWGKRAFLIGTGPSLLMTDLERLKGEITLASNKIFLAFSETSWRPTYYAIEDRLGIGEAVTFFDDFSATVKLLPFRRFREVGPRDDTIFFNFSSPQFYPEEPCFSENALVQVYWGSTVTYTLMQLAAYMGIRELFLLGVDFHYPGMETPERGNDPYAVTGANNNLHHFHSGYYRPGDQAHPPNLHVHETSYLAARKNYTLLGGAIYNATRGGRLEIFPRVSFDDLFPE